MRKEISSSNISFRILKESKGFLQLIIDDLSSCILILDREMRLYAFNNPIKTIFSNKPDEHLLYLRCGNAIGCAFAVEEIKECGSTSRCAFCELREKALLAYVNRDNVYKGRIKREFYKTDFDKALKHLQFSTRSFYFENEYYLFVIIDDITPFELKDVDEKVF
ncbi:MAG TPA: hypothetical protein VHO90_07805 [Bacteroidales bacterium]|nr:hypothetical protein [Bacteroidales bacterium]